MQDMKSVEANIENLPCIIRRIEKNQTKTGSPFLVLNLQTKDEKTLDAKRWDANAEELQLQEGKVITISGYWQEYQGNKYINIKHLLIDDGKIDTSGFLPKVENIEGLRENLQSCINQIEDENYKKLLAFVFHSGFMQRFCESPASGKIHHAKVGGLLQHTMEVYDIAVTASLILARRSTLNMSTIQCGSLIHDIGKVYTHSTDGGVIKTLDNEYLMGHISKGMEIVGYAESVLKADYTWVKHIIASHHGNREWGAIQEPSTKEAMIVHFADLFSSRIDMFDDLKGTEGKVWQKYLNHWIFEENNGRN